MEPNAVSFNPADAVAGGNLIDDCEATLISLRSCLFDYQGKIPAPIVALHAQWQYLVDGHPQIAHEYYSAGDTKNLAPSQDGRQLIPVGNQGGLNDSTNAYKFMVSFINGGWTTPIGKDLGIFDGARCYVKRVPQPKVQGASKDSKPLLVQKYLGQGQVLAMAPSNAMQTPQTPQMAAPQNYGQMAAPVAQQYAPPVAAQAPMAPAGLAGGAVGAGVGVGAAPAVHPLHDKAVGSLFALLTSKGGALPKQQIPALAFGALAADPDRNALVQLMFTDSFLGAPGVPWKFDGQMVSLG